jgi:hypothetical protein
MREAFDRSTGLVGDGYDEEPLLNAKEVGRLLGIPYKRVYELPIQHIRIGKRTKRYRPKSVKEYLDRRAED